MGFLRAVKSASKSGHLGIQGFQAQLLSEVDSDEGSLGGGGLDCGGDLAILEMFVVSCHGR